MLDVLIIGGGVMGSTIARYCSRQGFSTMVIDQGNEVLPPLVDAVISPGFTALPNTLSARFSAQGFAVMEELASSLHFTYQKYGSLSPCLQPADIPLAREIHQRCKKKSITDLLMVWSGVLLKLAPTFQPFINTALHSPRSAVIRPSEYLSAMRNDAKKVGCQFLWDHSVTNITKTSDGFIVTTPQEVLSCRHLINASGVSSADIHNLISAPPIQVTTKHRIYLSATFVQTASLKKILLLLPSYLSRETFLSPNPHGKGFLSFIEEEPSHSVLDLILAEFNKILSAMPLIDKDHPLSFPVVKICDGSRDVIVGETSPHFYEAIGFDLYGLSSAPAVAKYIVSLIDQ